ncbi:MAG: flagellin [Waltera sp.]
MPRMRLKQSRKLFRRYPPKRSALGAVQNRLEHTINNLDNVVENTTSAESQIRDTDMATEMVKYSNNNILAQAGQAIVGTG